MADCEPADDRKHPDRTLAFPDDIDNCCGFGDWNELDSEIWVSVDYAVVTLVKFGIIFKYEWSHSLLCKHEFIMWNITATTNFHCTALSSLTAITDHEKCSVYLFDKLLRISMVHDSKSKGYCPYFSPIQAMALDNQDGCRSVELHVRSRRTVWNRTAVWIFSLIRPLFFCSWFTSDHPWIFPLVWLSRFPMHSFRLRFVPRADVCFFVHRSFTNHRVLTRLFNREF